MIQFCLNNTINLRHLTQRIISCYTHSGDRIVNIDSVTSLHLMYFSKTYRWKMAFSIFEGKVATSDRWGGQICKLVISNFLCSTNAALLQWQTSTQNSETELEWDWLGDPCRSSLTLAATRVICHWRLDAVNHIHIHTGWVNPSHELLSPDSSEEYGEWSQKQKSTQKIK